MSGFVLCCREMIESTCEILRCLMDRLDPVESLQKYHESILQGFFHPVPDVPALVVAHVGAFVFKCGRFIGFND